MATIRVFYQLDESGRKASLLAGGNGKAAQFIDVEMTAELLAVVHVDDNGNATYNLSPLEVCYPIVRNWYSAPLSMPEAVVEVLRIAAEKQAKAEQATREAAEKKAVEEKARAEKDTQWLALVKRYAAGDPEVKKTEQYTYQLNHVDSWYASTPELRAQIDAEATRREKIQAEVDAAKRAAKEKAQAEIDAKIDAARLAWLRAHGTVDQVERFEERVLPHDELMEAIHAATLPTTLGGVEEYQAHSSAEVEHEDNCDEESSVVWEVEDGNDCALTSAQWARLKAVRVGAAEIPGAVVDVRKHVANLSCECPDPFWLAARVRVLLTDLDIEVQRQYTLDE